MTTNQGKVSMKLIAEFADGKQADVGTIGVDLVAGVTEDELFDTARRAVEHGLAAASTASAPEPLEPADPQALLDELQRLGGRFGQVAVAEAAASLMVPGWTPSESGQVSRG